MNLIHNKRRIIRCHPRPTPIPHFPHPRAFRTIKCLTNSPSTTHRAEWLHAPSLIGVLLLPFSVIYHELPFLTNAVVLGFCTPGNRIGVFAVQSKFCSRYGHSTKLFLLHLTLVVSPYLRSNSPSQTLFS